MFGCHMLTAVIVKLYSKFNFIIIVRDLMYFETKLKKKFVFWVVLLTRKKKKV